jgi:asparagine synthase (glutamine-hydrolysing)
MDGTLFNREELVRGLPRDSAFAEPLAPAALVLAAYQYWGEKCLAKLSGNFALVILDRTQRICLLAADPLGAKPLNYAIDGERLSFASEFRALHALRRTRRVNPLALMEFVLHGDILPPRSPYHDIEVLPAGHFLRIAHGERAQVRCYNDVVDVVSESEYGRLLATDPALVIDELERLVDQSVRVNMQDAGSCGVALSGGVDSATLAAMARRYAAVTAITVSVPAHTSYDERQMAETVARRVGVPISVVPVDGRSYRSALVESTAANELPLWHVQNVAYYLASQRAREMGLDTLLCGDTFGSMLSPATQLPWTRLDPLLGMFRQLPNALAAFARKLGFALPFDGHAFSHYHPLAVQLSDGYAHHARRLVTNAAYRWVRNGTERRMHGGKLAETGSYYRRFFHRGDRLGYAHGVEYRTPFGDTAALRFAMNLPFSFLVRDGTPKWCVKALGERYLPREIAFQKKVAWDFPGDVFLGNLAAARFFTDGYCAELFSISRAAVPAALEHWRQEHHRLSRIVHLEIWGRLHARGESTDHLQELLRSFE